MAEVPDFGVNSAQQVISEVGVQAKTVPSTARLTSWAIAHRLCRVVCKILHEGLRFIEQGMECDPKLRKHRARSLAGALRKRCYNVQITSINPSTAVEAM
ncbi:MAG: hypothetical protein WA197_22190 [Candidatus Acidiferrales bacterium]